jgi:hypothetical protein
MRCAAIADLLGGPGRYSTTAKVQPGVDASNGIWGQQRLMLWPRNRDGFKARRRISSSSITHLSVVALRCARLESHKNSPLAAPTPSLSPTYSQCLRRAGRGEDFLVMQMHTDAPKCTSLRTLPPVSAATRLMEEVVRTWPSSTISNYYRRAMRAREACRGLSRSSRWMPRVACVESFSTAFLVLPRIMVLRALHCLSANPNHQYLKSLGI